MEISIRHDLEAFGRDVVRMEKQMPFVAALALTLTARDALVDLKTHLAEEIDRPRPFTTNSMYVERATKQNLQAEILFKRGAGGRGAGKYLRSIAYGQPRGPKAFEGGLAARGTLKSGMYAVPARGQSLDAQGNVPGSVIRAMLSDAGVARGLPAFSNAKTRKKRRRKGKKVYFTPLPGSKLAPGIYESGGRSRPKLAMLFVKKQPRYEQRLHKEEVALKTVNRVIADRFVEAFDRANSTSRF